MMVYTLIYFLRLDTMTAGQSNNALSIAQCYEYTAYAPIRVAESLSYFVVQASNNFSATCYEEVRTFQHSRYPANKGPDWFRTFTWVATEILSVPLALLGCPTKAVFDIWVDMLSCHGENVVSIAAYFGIRAPEPVALMMGVWAVLHILVFDRFLKKPLGLLWHDMKTL
jgi:hypothetical protein